MDVLTSGPAGPRRRRAGLAGRLAGPLRRLGTTVGGALGGRRSVRRWVGVGLALLVTAGVLGALRSGAEPVGEPVVGGSPVATVPAPPFDRLPGRVPIPPPTHAGWFVRGELPPVGPPGHAAAQWSALLVLGRFCARPDRYTLTLEPRRDWRSVSVLGFGLNSSGHPPAIRLELSWTGTAYDWTGMAVQLSAC